MPLHDIKCSKCGHIEEIFFQPSQKPSSFSCIRCNGDSKIMLGTPRIDMQDRPIERRLEREAANGVF
jgi:predicted nucleic acid-binding Zn ribbon protein